MKNSGMRLVPPLLGLGMLLTIVSLGAYSEDTLAVAEPVYGCGLQPHVHAEACYLRELACPLVEGEEHSHSEACYRTELACGLPEHSHSEACIIMQPVADQPEASTEDGDTTPSQQETPPKAGETPPPPTETPTEDGEAAPSPQVTPPDDGVITPPPGESSALVGQAPPETGETPSSEQENQDSDEKLPEESPPPTAKPEAEAIGVSLSASVSSCFAGDSPGISYTITGGTPPYTLSATYGQGSESRQITSLPDSAVGRFYVSPWTHGTLSVTLTVKDSAENAGSASAYISVATRSGTESADMWEATLPEIPADASNAKALLMVAQSQLGYEEVTTNFVAEGGELKGYSRYGAWYGIPYGDWCAMFVSFCLNYAQIPRSEIPIDCACQSWINTLRTRDLYSEASEYDPKPGDIVFFSSDGSFAGHVGIVEAVEMTVDGVSRVSTIEGNNCDCVGRFNYEGNDPRLLGYLPLSDAMDK